VQQTTTKPFYASGVGNGDIKCYPCPSVRPSRLWFPRNSLSMH